MTARERSGWRDQEVSARHRRWGFNCPAVDLDFLMVEYHLGVPVAVIEYKHHRHHEGDDVNLDHATYRALSGLADADARPLPFLIARYWPGAWAFRVLAVNGEARKHLSRNGWVDMTEEQFVRGLYRMRNLKAEETVLRNLNRVTPRQADKAAG